APCRMAASQNMTRRAGILRAMKSGSRGLFAAVAACLVLGACGGGGTQEIASVDDGLDGPLPTAPEGGSGGGGGDPFSGDVDFNELIRRIEALNEVDDLCTLLTGEAADLTSADINLASLAANPSAFSQLFASLENVFGHMIDIAPDDAKPPLSTLQGVWAGMSSIDVRAADAEATASRLLASDETQAANDALGVWVTGNCTPA
ncbi:MAG: hypothetical protein ACR2OH_14910, partial [Microthrixaceae bacterium]